MDRPAVSTMTTQRIDRLLRSLVGVADVRMLWRAHTLRAVHILRDAATQPHQLIRNVVSGLHAGFGIQLLPTHVHIHDDVDVFDAIDVAADVLTDTEAGDTPTPAPAPNGANGGAWHAADGNGRTHNGNGRTYDGSGTAGKGRAHGNGTAGEGKGGLHGNARIGSGKAGLNGGGSPAKPAPNGAGARAARDGSAQPTHAAGEPVTPMVARPSGLSADLVAAAAELVARRQHDDANEGLTLERIDVERRSGMLRCRTVLALGDQKYSAIAEVPDSPSAEAELAARVAVDALRAGGLTEAMLDGVGFITIAKTNYCVATVREPGSAHPRASAAPMIDSMAASATAAVLMALGSFTDARARNRARAGH